MPLPPAWKIRREAWRIREQVRSFLAPLVEVPRQRFYDRFVFPKLPIKRGELPVGDKIALVILYQPKGLAASTIFTFDHLVSKGWTPVAVSNAPLSHEDERALGTRCAHIVTRPNIGYDFGAYRDGIRTLTRLGLAPRKLIAMNDSTWFPLSESDDTLDRLEQLNADMAGHILKIEDANNRSRDHIESHLLMFGPSFLKSKQFSDFWTGYVMSDYRDTTIERGEKALSQLVMKSDLSERALLSREAMCDLLDGLDDQALLDVMKNIVHHRRPHHDMVARLIASAENGGTCWRVSFLDWTKYELSHSLQHLVSTTFIYPALRYGGLGFMKKSKELRFHLARKKLLEVESAGLVAPLHPAVRQEVSEAVETWTAPYDWRRRPEHHKREQEERLGP